MNGILKIVTKLERKTFNSELSKLKADVKTASSDVNIGESMGVAVKSAMKYMATIAAVLALVKLLVASFKEMVANNDDLAQKIDKIKTAFSNIIGGIVTALSNILYPIVNWIVSAVLQILVYINAVSKALFNFDLFAKKGSQSLVTGAKASKDIKKNLAGFDQINKLSDNSSSGGGGVGAIENSGLLELPKVSDGILAKVWNKLDGWSSDFVDWLANIFVSIWNSLSDFGADFVDWLVKGWYKLSDFGADVVDWMAELMIKVWNKITKFFEDAKLGVKNTFDSIKNTITNIFTTIKTFIVDKIITPIKTKFEEFKTSIVNIFTNIKDALKTPLNTIIGWLNTLIGGLNKIKLPEWGILGNAAGKGINIPKIPKLAKGGIVDLPGSGINIGGAIAGEKGAEAVIPLTDGTLQKLASMIPITIDLTNTIDGRVLNRRLQQINSNTNFAKGGF